MNEIVFGVTAFLIAACIDCKDLHSMSDNERSIGHTRTLLSTECISLLDKAFDPIPPSDDSEFEPGTPELGDLFLPGDDIETEFSTSKKLQGVMSGAVMYPQMRTKPKKVGVPKEPKIAHDEVGTIGSPRELVPSVYWPTAEIQKPFEEPVTLSLDKVDWNRAKMLRILFLNGGTDNVLVEDVTFSLEDGGIVRYNYKQKRLRIRGYDQKYSYVPVAIKTVLY